MKLFSFERTLFRKSVIGTETIGNSAFTIVAQKRLLCSGRYTVKIEDKIQGQMGINGNFGLVDSTMRKNKRARAGIGLFKEVARSIGDSPRAKEYGCNEQLCLAVLVDGAADLKSISKKGGILPVAATKALNNLIAIDIVERCKNKGEAIRKFSLTPEGQQEAMRLVEECLSCAKDDTGR